MNKLLRAHILFHLLRSFPRKYRVADPNLSVQPFFILGSGRNGSTMLNRMLNQHSELFLPSEQYFLGPSIFKFHYYNYAIWRDLVKIIVGELSPGAASHTWTLKSLPDLKSLFLLPKTHKNLQYLLDMMYRHYGESIGKLTRWGDTTPLNTYYLPEVYHTFPKAKYLFLIRDGRDVVASYKKGGSAMLNELAIPSNAARHWMHSLEKWNYLSRKTEVMLVRYEELVQHPEGILREISEYLNVGYQPQMMDFHQKIPDTEMYKLAIHENLKRPVFNSSIGNYKEILSQDEIKEVTDIIQVGLKKFGYS